LNGSAKVRAVVLSAKFIFINLEETYRDYLPVCEELDPLFSSGLQRYIRNYSPPIFHA